jgi:ATP-dependent DNA ligase
VTLPSELSRPVQLALAKAQEDVPTPSSMVGGAVYELKWDGFR